MCIVATYMKDPADISKRMPTVNIKVASSISKSKEVSMKKEIKQNMELVLVK